jgi:hypothetical protein
MPLFAEPDHKPFEALLKGGPTLLTLVGWATVAVGLSLVGPHFWTAGVGLVAALFAHRFFKVTLVVETLALAFALALGQETSLEWIGLGAPLIGLARLGVYFAVWKRDGPPA